MSNNTSISTKLIIGFLLLIGLPILVSSYNNYKLAEETFREQILSDLFLVVEVEEAYLLEFLAGSQKRVVDFSSDGFIRDSAKEILAGNEEATLPLNNHLVLNKQSLDDTIFGINVFDLDGVVIASTDEREIGVHSLHGHETHDFSSALKLSYGESYLSDVYNVPHFGIETNHFVVAAPLTDKVTGEKLGVIVNYIKLENLNKALSGNLGEGHITTHSMEKRETFEIYLVNKDSMMITDSKFVEDAILKQKVDTEPVRACKENHAMTGIYDAYRDVQIVGASACIINGWTLLAEIDEDEAFSGLEEIKRNTITTGMLFLFGILALAYFVVRYVTRPIEELADAAKKISEGKLTQSVTVRSKDEIGKLALIFNTMAVKLQESHQGLENKVKERTAELEKFNKAMVGRELKMIELKKELESLKRKK